MSRCVQLPPIQSLGGSSLQELVDYYDKNVAPIMVWIDTEDNLYRNHVLPLAHTNPAVRLAVAAVAAQHAAMFRGEPDVPEDIRNEAVSMITKYVHDVTKQVANGCDIGQGLDINAAEWILASMLVLSCYEMAHSGAQAADFHRKAARSLVNTLSGTECRKSTLFISLQNMLSTYDIFANTTSFDLLSIQDAILPQHDHDSVPNEAVLFSDYLLLLHEVTLLSRQGHGVKDTSHDWRAEFELARGKTLMVAGRLAISSAQQRRDLIRLVDIHHNAALLYIARCLGHGLGLEFPAALLDLKRQLLALENIYQWTQNLPWPIFIAGVESYGDGESQAIVSELYKVVVEATKLKQYCQVLDFLNKFWSGNEPDWQVPAKEWEERGHRILAY